MSFLIAEWRKLVMVNYEVNPEILKPYVPNGTELDFFRGKCYVSLVGFMFLNTKLLGIKIPFHSNFEEVNLRFYVKRTENKDVKRGVVFIKEIVPKPVLTFVANTVYKENYETLPMKHSWKNLENQLEVSYEWKVKGKWNKMFVEVDKEQQVIQENSVIEFISEHYWGYAKKNEKETNEYEVKHPKWQYYNVNNYQLDIDFEANYGTVFKLLSSAKPNSVMLLEGSDISVENKVAIN